MGYKTKVVALVLCLTFIVSARAYSQSQKFIGFSYQVSTPLSDTKSFTDDFSFRNVGFDARSEIRRNVTVGLSLGWNVFGAQTNEVVSIGAFDGSGTQRRFVNAFPILVTTHYYFGLPGSMGPRPYVGAGVGTYYIDNRLEVGTVAINDSNWHFGVAPEAGIVFSLNRDTAAFVNARFNYAVKSGNFTHAYWGFGVGLAWQTY